MKGEEVCEKGVKVCESGQFLGHPGWPVCNLAEVCELCVCVCCVVCLVVVGGEERARRLWKREH